METAFRAHPLWAGCKEEELESAVPDDVKADEQLSEKMSLIQHFVRPENLDIKPSFENETSWLANPPQLHSNLLYIQRYRRQSRLVGEAAYFFTIRPRTAETRSRTMDAESSKDVVSSLDKVSSMLDIQNRGAALILKEDRAKELLNSYKQLVFKYVCVCKGLGSGGGGGGASLLSISGDQGSVQNDVEPMKYFQEPETVVEQSNEHGKQNDSLIAESKRLEVEIDPTARKN
ncbi:unnamed protein product [Linum tenue]|uniref:Uncharacterized protein n=1 Tax=Linum tenue TaxID=586396 RepID=A0AAV0MIR6_9ROSI|nr:unnamed protein product [Linum tenue]